MSSSRKAASSSTYSGTVCDVTTTRYFLKALERLVLESPSLESRIRFRIVGRVTGEEEKHVKAFAFPSMLDVVGYVSHKRSLELLLASDLLLVIVDEIEGSDRIATSKVYECIASRIPLLALVPTSGTVAGLVRETCSGVVVSNMDADGIRSAIASFVSGELAFDPDVRPLEVFTREATARQFAECLNRLSLQEQRSAAAS